MIPVYPVGHNVTYTGDGTIAELLPAIRRTFGPGVDQVVTNWLPSAAELKAIADGGMIALAFLVPADSPALPPVAVYVEGVSDPEEEPVQ